MLSFYELSLVSFLNSLDRRLPGFSGKIEPGYTALSTCDGRPAEFGGEDIVENLTHLFALSDLTRSGSGWSPNPLTVL